MSAVRVKTIGAVYIFRPHLSITRLTCFVVPAFTFAILEQLLLWTRRSRENSLLGKNLEGAKRVPRPDAM
jgi:hypothetical protein